jgi:hypothetical protein
VHFLVSYVQIKIILRFVLKKSKIYIWMQKTIPHTTQFFLSFRFVFIVFFQTNQILKYTFIISIWGEGSCAAAPFRALAVKWPLGCPPHAACCTEYGYCRPAEEWAAGNFRYSYKQLMSNYSEIDWNIFLFKKTFWITNPARICEKENHFKI